MDTALQEDYGPHWRVLRKAPRKIRGLENSTCGERLKDLARVCLI